MSKQKIRYYTQGEKNVDVIHANTEKQAKDAYQKKHHEKCDYVGELDK